MASACKEILFHQLPQDFFQNHCIAHPRKHRKLECGQMPNVMVALPNTGGALCSAPQSLADAHYWSAVQ